MDFALTDDQTALITALDGLAVRYAAPPIEFRTFALVDPGLEKELEDGGFFDIAAVPELGPVSAAIAVERLARLPYAAEFAFSMLVRPQLPDDVPRPIALIEDGRPGRFVASARTILVKDDRGIGIAHPSHDQLEPVESLFAYPMGRARESLATRMLSDTEAANARKWIRVALAAEASGLLHAAIEATVEHLTIRKQFGRPLGSFQALRHRLAECAVLAGGVRWLALKAASTGAEGDAALAALHAQESAARVAFDVHQMLGAMGMTLEHPLHLWTYRLKALISDLGGPSRQAAAVGRHCFEFEQGS